MNTSWMRTAALGGVLSTLMAFSVAAAEWHVTPDGTAGNSGTAASPWSLDFALSAKSAARPGDTIWVHGGTYTGMFICFLHGDAKAPIRVRNWANDRVTIAGQLDINYWNLSDTCYVWFQGMEVTNRQLGKAPVICVGMSNSDPKVAFNTGIKLINMVIHDGAIGVQTEGHGIEDEIYGCIIYYTAMTRPTAATGTVSTFRASRGRG